MRNRLFPLLLALIIASLAFGTALADVQSINGTAAAPVQGFGGDVTVFIEVEDSIITGLTAQGPNETEVIAGPVLDKFNTQIFPNFVGKNIDTVNFDEIDIPTGATITAQAVVNSAKLGLMELKGSTSVENLQDLRQTYYVKGFSLTDKFGVEVTIKDNRIANIEVVDQGKETPAILQTVIDRMIPRIIEHQSLAVDAISGATLSSNGVRSAVTSAIKDAGGEPANWYRAIPKSNEVVTIEGYDVIVVGLGGSGLAAYLSASEQGVSVFGIEKAGKIGGTSTIISGPMAINPKTKMDIQNSGEKFLEEEDLIQDWLEYTRGDAKEELVRFFVEESGETMDWLIENYDFQFGNIRAFFHPKMWAVWAAYQGDINVMYNNALNMALAKNPKNDYMLELTAKNLLVDDANRIIGVEAELYDGTIYRIYGDAVILATGGYVGNPEMQKEFLGGAWRTFALDQNDGAGIQMGRSVGGALYNINMPPMQHVAGNAVLLGEDSGLTPNDKAVLAAMVLNPDTMVVDTTGKRFLNESGLIAFDSWKAGPYYYTIFSQDQIDRYREKGMDYAQSPMYVGQGGSVTVGQPIPNMEQIMETAVAYGAAFKANTLEELAELLGMENLVEEVALYNSYSTGEAVDPFGKDASYIDPIGETGPYYAVKGAAYIYGTIGGLDVDINMNVLDETGKPIPGLYAVGQDSMGVLFTPQDAYVSYGGAAHGWVLTSGRIAGANAAEYVMSK